MRMSLKMAITTFALVAGLAAAPALYAQSAEATPGPLTSPNGPGTMMGQGNMTGPGTMMGQGGMMGPGTMMGPGGMSGPGTMMGPGNAMMGQMAGRMGQMMATHTELMQTMIDAYNAAQPGEE